MKFQPKVPLIADTETRDGETAFVVWDGEPGRIVRPARRPGFWCATADGSVAESAMKRRLSDTSAPATMWHRLEFRTDREARDYAERRTREGYASYLGDVDRYITRIVVEDPAFFKGLPMTRPLRILAVDIEQRTDGTGFPSRDAPMVSIALSFLGTDDETPKVTPAAADPDTGEPDDNPVMEAWFEAITMFDPDIIVGFNVGYDIGVLAERGRILGFPLDKWGRVDANGEPRRCYSQQEWNGKFTDEVFYIGGRIVWDLRSNANAMSDYNLSGCKDFKLKTIAEFLGWPAIKEDTKNTLALWRDRPDDLVRYNANDTDLVRRMVERYLPDRIGMAEFFGAPLDMTIDVKSGWSGTIACARILFQVGIVSDGTNLERHRQWVRTQAEKDGEDDDDEGMEDHDKRFVKFQGAIINCPRPGLHKPVFKVDYASLYPKVALAVGCGPDNTRIIGTETLGAFRTQRNGESLTLSIPDENYGHNWLIEVRGKSLFTVIVKARMDERLAAKHSKDATRAAILKTILNSMSFGVPGALHNRYGVWPMGIIAAGVSREMVKAIGRVVDNIAIETDTDGIYLTAKPDLAGVNRAANAAAESYGFDPCFEVELEDFPAGWFHKAKQYLLLDHDGTLIRKGGAMKGRMHPAVFDRIIERVGGALLRQGRTAALLAARRATNLDAYAPTDFIQRVTLGKKPEAYVHETKEVKVAKAHEAELGVPITPGRSYEYVRTRDGMKPPTPANLAQLDEWAYLSKVIIPALERLGFSDLRELGLAERAKTIQARSKRPTGEMNLSKFM